MYQINKNVYVMKWWQLNKLVEGFCLSFFSWGWSNHCSLPWRFVWKRWNTFFSSLACLSTLMLMKYESYERGEHGSKWVTVYPLYILTLGNVIAPTKIIEKTSISVKLSPSALSIILVPSNRWKKSISLFNYRNFLKMYSAARKYSRLRINYRKII